MRTSRRVLVRSHRERQKARSSVCRLSGFEQLESRCLLSSTPGNEILNTWFVEDHVNPNNNKNNALVNGPAVAQNIAGTRIVMTHATGYENDGNLNDVYVREYETVDGMTLTQRREYKIESSSLIGSWQKNPVVSMDSNGAKYVVAWMSSSGNVRAVVVDWQTQTMTSPTDIATDVTVNNITYDLGGQISVAMREDGKFVAAWNSNASSGGQFLSSEAQARVFNSNLTPVTNLITELMPVGWSKDPVVAWTNNGNAPNWDVLWYGEDGVPPPPPQSNQGHYLQKWSIATTPVKQNQLFVIPKPFSYPSPFEYHTQYGMSNDPSGNVVIVTKVGGNSADGPGLGVRLRALKPSGSTFITYPGLPSTIDTYPWNTLEANQTAFPTIDIDASYIDPQGNRSFRKIIVGSQKWAEGPTSQWALLDALDPSGPTWLSYGQVQQHTANSIQDMFLAPSINRPGNWWVFGYQYLMTIPSPGDGKWGGWAIRGWDPPGGDTRDPLGFALLARSWNTDRKLPSSSERPAFNVVQRTKMKERVELVGVPVLNRQKIDMSSNVESKASDEIHAIALLDLLDETSDDQAKDID